MFYDVYCALCRQHGLSPSGGSKEIGFNRASVTVWKNTGNPPKPALLQKIADYFGVSTDYLLGGGPQQAPGLPPAPDALPELNSRDKRDIAKRLEATLDLMDNNADGLMFDGQPLDDETCELLRISLQNQLEISKRIAKQKFPPKKYRKD